MPAQNQEHYRIRPIGNIRRFLLVSLGTLLVLCLLAAWFIHRTTTARTGHHDQARTDSQPIVDTTTWQTAHALAATAATYQEALYARQAEQLADHEVDSAFSASIRCAELANSSSKLTNLSCPGFRRTKPISPKKADEISKRVRQLQKAVVQDKLSIAQLKSQAEATTEGPNPDAARLADKLQLAQYQLALDSDELSDAQLQLDKVTGNRLPGIQNEFAAHEKTMRSFDKQQNSDVTPPLHHIGNAWTLAGRIKIWLGLHALSTQLNQARANSLQDAASLTRRNNNLNHLALNPKSSVFSELARPKNRIRLRRILLINNDRIQTDKSLAKIYNAWTSEVQLQKRIILNRILQSLAIILAIILAVILFETILYRLSHHPAFDRRQMQTFRAIFKVGIQVLGVLIILLLIFGAPNETGTVIGLITAALALALQDYIVAFFGWFMLSGPNGIHVGDMVEIDGVCGEVIDIGLLKTTLLETTGLQEKGEPTGRRVSLLNSFAVHGTCFNFSSEGQWLWDEITVSVPASEYIYAIAASVAEIAKTETAESARLAEQEWNRNLPATSLNRASAEPIIMLKPSTPYLDAATSIDIQIRFVTRAVGRYEIRDRLYQHVIQMLQDQKRLDTPPPPDTTPSPA